MMAARRPDLDWDFVQFTPGDFRGSHSLKSALTPQRGNRDWAQDTARLQAVGSAEAGTVQPSRNGLEKERQ